MKIVCISDTHGLTFPTDLPDGDVLIHAGDLSLTGQPYEIAETLDWLRKFPHEYKVFIGGNHDNALAEFGCSFFEEQMRPYKGRTPLIYLCGSKIKIEDKVFFGSAAIPHNNMFRAGARAFMLDATTSRHWGHAPNCDVLITHGPPAGILDSPGRYGDAILKAYVFSAKPKLHVFGHVHSGHVHSGHVHSGHGQTEENGIKFVNAALLDEAYKPGPEPIVVEI